MLTDGSAITQLLCPAGPDPTKKKNLKCVQFWRHQQFQCRSRVKSARIFIPISQYDDGNGSALGRRIFSNMGDGIGDEGAEAIIQRGRAPQLILVLADVPNLERCRAELGVKADPVLADELLVDPVEDGDGGLADDNVLAGAGVDAVDWRSLAAQGILLVPITKNAI